MIKLIDVGARGGIHPRWKPFYPELDVLAFEPDVEECARLNKTKFPYRVRHVPVALGERDGEQATLHITREPGSSSLYRPNTALVSDFEFGDALAIIGEIPLTLSRLDSVCGEFRPDAIKIDTQGTELAILKGAGAMLHCATAVEIEVEFVPQYEEQPLFADVDTFMRASGFRLRGLRRSVWRERGARAHPYGGQLMYGDALYLRPERMDNETGHRIAAAYRQYDLLERFGATHLIPAQNMASRLAGKVAARFEHRSLRRFLDSLRVATATDWHDPDFF